MGSKHFIAEGGSSHYKAVSLLILAATLQNQKRQRHFLSLTNEEKAGSGEGTWFEFARAEGRHFTPGLSALDSSLVANDWSEA